MGSEMSAHLLSLFRDLSGTCEKVFQLLSPEHRVVATLVLRGSFPSLDTGEGTEKGHDGKVSFGYFSSPTVVETEDTWSENTEKYAVDEKEDESQDVNGVSASTSYDNLYEETTEKKKVMIEDKLIKLEQETDKQEKHDQAKVSSPSADSESEAENETFDYKGVREKEKSGYKNVVQENLKIILQRYDQNNKTVSINKVEETNTTVLINKVEEDNTTVSINEVEENATTVSINEVEENNKTVSINKVEENKKPDSTRCIKIDKSETEDGELMENGELFNWICKKCGQDFTNSKIRQRAFRQHKKRHSLINTVCACDSQFSNFTEIWWHTKITHLSHFACTKCKLTFKANSKLEEHYNSHEKIIKTNEENECDICGKRFKTTNRSSLDKRRFSEHMKRHKVMDSDCGCGLLFDNFYKKDKHIRVVHKGHFGCRTTWCKQSFIDQDKLIKHEMTHKEHLICNECGKQLLNKN